MKGKKPPDMNGSFSEKHQLLLTTKDASGLAATERVVPLFWETY